MMCASSPYGRCGSSTDYLEIASSRKESSDFLWDAEGERLAVVCDGLGSLSTCHLDVIHVSGTYASRRTPGREELKDGNGVAF